MFNNSQIFALGEGEKAKIFRISVNAVTQNRIIEMLRKKSKETLKKKRIAFNGEYKVEKDETLCIFPYELPKNIKEAIKNPINKPYYQKENGQYPKIKAVFIGECMNDNEKEEKFRVAMQKIRKSQHIHNKGVNLYCDSNTFIEDNKYSISIMDIVDCCYDNGALLFDQYYYARQVLDLNQHYRLATDQEVRKFISNKSLEIQNPNGFYKKANEWIRKRIALINDSRILVNNSVKDIKDIADKSGIPILINKGRIVIPSDGEKLKLVICFLVEEAYAGAFSKDVYLTNSKRKIE